MEDIFFKYLEDKFPIQRLRNDIEHYIGYIENANNCILAYHEFEEEEEKKIEYHPGDNLTLISIIAKRKYHGLPCVPVIVQVGIGDWFVDVKTGYYESSKCTAEIRYNEYFEMFSIDFSYR